MLRLTVLIVDDSEVDRYLLSRDLEKAEFEIALFEQQNGEDAIKFLKDSIEDEKPIEGCYPDVIFLDVNMPRMNGHQFLQAYQQLNLHTVYSKTKIIMYTSSERKEDIDSAQAYSFVSDYLIKGNYTNDILKNKLDAVIQADHY